LIRKKILCFYVLLKAKIYFLVFYFILFLFLFILKRKVFIILCITVDGFSFYVKNNERVERQIEMFLGGLDG
jgi:hypothetical protein